MRPLPAADGAVHTAADLRLLEREGPFIGRTLILHRSAMKYVAGDRLPVHLPIGLDVLDDWTEGGVAGPEEGERRWRFTFAGGGTVAAVRIADDKAGEERAASRRAARRPRPRSADVYCSCGLPPCGHAVAALAIASAESVGDDFSTDAYAQFLQARADRADRQDQMDHLVSACDNLETTMLEVIKEADLNAPGLRGTVAAHLGRPLEAPAQPRVRSVAEAMRRR